MINTGNFGKALEGRMYNNKSHYEKKNKKSYSNKSKKYMNRKGSKGKNY